MPRILVADDDRTTRLLLTETLRAEKNFAVVTASDGDETLKKIRAGKFDLVLLDVWMPKKTGIEVLTALKSLKNRPKIIVMTSDDAPETVLNAVREQAYQYIAKPFDPKVVMALLKETLGKGTDAMPIEVLSARPEWVEIVVPCTLDAAERIENFMAQLKSGLSEDVRRAVGQAFHELLLNAIEWGGKLDPTRKVRISYLRAKRMLLYRIADPGPGFKVDELTHAAISHSPDDPTSHDEVRREKGLRPGGFGLLLAQANVDELLYNEARNEVVFVKYLDE
ncbi:MAG TPA: response regulator [Verrucomicrobiae bacterium]|nr:response regulator [Verrucomicrobiae bacterium]